MARVPKIEELSPAWRKKRQQTVAHILSTAMEIVRELGLGGLTIPLLAQRLGNTVGSMYRYFPSKSAIIAELQRQVAEAISEELGAGLAASRPRVEAALGPQAATLTGLVVFARVYDNDPQGISPRISLVSQALSEVVRPVGPEDDPRVMQAVMPVLQALVRFCDEAAACGALRPGDANQRAMVYWGNVHGALLMRNVTGLDPGFVDVGRLSQASVAATLGGWGANVDLLSQIDVVVGSGCAEDAPPRAEGGRSSQLRTVTASKRKASRKKGSAQKTPRKNAARRKARRS